MRDLDGETIHFDTPPAALHRWEWEEAVNSLRRPQDRRVDSLWKTTGNAVIDAKARAHIGEWLALDVDEATDPEQAPSTIVNALVDRALRQKPWELYVVEASTAEWLSVRRLRDERGHGIRWVEGRQHLEPGSIIGLRLAHLDPPGIDVATLPIRFGFNPGPKRLVMALLRAFGSQNIDDWPTFMRGTGGRIILEYGLNHLQQRAIRHGEDNTEAGSQKRARVERAA